MRPVLLALTAWLALLPLQARAENVVIVELYTSQGCSSCPPADALLAELANEPNVLPLAFHVDYWDFIGWRDTFAKPGNALRQRAYAMAAGKSTVFTPHFVVSGRHHIAGAQAMKLSKAIQQAAPESGSVALAMTDHGVTVRAAAPAATEITIYAVDFMDRAEVAITDGENAGHTLVYHNIVERIIMLGEITSPAETAFDLPAPLANANRVVFAQTSQPGPILGAIRVASR